MHCSNPDCRQEAHDLQSGTLRLMEMEVPPEERVTRADYGFPVVAVPAKHLWLCEACARLFRIKRWTRAGVVLEPLGPKAGSEARAGKIAPGRAAGSLSKLAIEHVA
jgi:hypothetical protein